MRTSYKLGVTFSNHLLLEKIVLAWFCNSPPLHPLDLRQCIALLAVT